MGQDTNIEWCDHTFNPWIGCTKVSPGCAHCYAETLMDTRYGRVKWGKGQPRVRTSAANWKLPLRWSREAERVGLEWAKNLGPVSDLPHRPRVFCASLADWLDDEVPIEWLADLLDLIRRTPNLDWLLLTKRPENWSKRMEAIHAIRPAPSQDGWMLANEWLGGRAPANVWVGTTVEDQQRADERISHLLAIPARVRFLSCEPLLGPVHLPLGQLMTGFPKHITADGRAVGAPLSIHWVIAGGESGAGARPMHPTWANRIKTQCRGAGVPFLFKQWGEWAPCDKTESGFSVTTPADIKTPNEPALWQWNDGTHSARVGKKAAGRLLDGVEQNAFPEVTS